MFSDIKDLDYIHCTYEENFGVTQLNLFFERSPSKNPIRWYIKKYLTYFLIYFYIPVWLVIQFLGLFLSEEAEMDLIYFQIGYLSHISQIYLKMLYFIKKIDEFRSLCLRFDEFHTMKHRPVLSKKILGGMGSFLRKLSKMSFTAMHTNAWIWTLTGLVVQPALYLLHQKGYISQSPKSAIPKPFPLTYPFHLNFRNRIFVAVFELITVSVGGYYALPLDLFYVTVFMMICAQLEVLSKSAETAEELVRTIGGSPVILDPEDDQQRMDIKLIIEDHQSLLKTTKKIREIMNPMLGVEICYFIVMLATMALTGTVQMKRSESFSERFKQIPGLVAATISIMSTLYLYSWMCGRLKEAEENFFRAVYFTDWYKQEKKYRDAVLIMMGGSLRSRPLRMLSTGNWDKETFISGLKGIYTYYNFMANNKV